jgi:MFS family permease
LSGFQQSGLSNELAGQWRRLTRAATLVALLTAPVIVVWLNQTEGWSWFWSILAALFLVVCFRGLVDLVFHRLIPRPSLFGLESPQLRDIVPRRIRGLSMRLPAACPRREQIYFIGATNVPVDRLDPALTRPGRMGRHVWFRTRRSRIASTSSTSTSGRSRLRRSSTSRTAARRSRGSRMATRRRCWSRSRRWP